MLKAVGRRVNRRKPVLILRCKLCVVGKTHLAIALGKRLCREGHPTQFLPINFLFEEIQAAKAAGRYLNYIRSLITAKALILDDLGLRNYTQEEATSLKDILEERRLHSSSLLRLSPRGLNGLKIP